jgi:hypothetical protein
MKNGDKGFKAGGKAGIQKPPSFTQFLSIEEFSLHLSLLKAASDQTLAAG